MSTTKIRPLGDRVIVKPEKAERKTDGGILIPETTEKQSTEGTVLAVGPGKQQQDGKLIKPEVSVGNKVVFNKYAGTGIKLDGEDVLIMNETDVMAVLE